MMLRVAGHGAMAGLVMGLACGLALSAQGQGGGDAQGGSERGEVADESRVWRFVEPQERVMLQSYDSDSRPIDRGMLEDYVQRNRGIDRMRQVVRARIEAGDAAVRDAPRLRFRNESLKTWYGWTKELSVESVEADRVVIAAELTSRLDAIYEARMRYGRFLGMNSRDIRERLPLYRTRARYVCKLVCDPQTGRVQLVSASPDPTDMRLSDGPLGAVFKEVLLDSTLSPRSREQATVRVLFSSSVRARAPVSHSRRETRGGRTTVTTVRSMDGSVFAPTYALELKLERVDRDGEQEPQP